jgi:hypothetical protein
LPMILKLFWIYGARNWVVVSTHSDVSDWVCFIFIYIYIYI